MLRKVGLQLDFLSLRTKHKTVIKKVGMKE